jgi:hypothetical protein
MGALRVAFERREAPDSPIEFVEVLRCRQIINIVENLDAFNFDLAEALIPIRTIRSSSISMRSPQTRRKAPKPMF